MSATVPPVTREQLAATVAARAWTDEAFHRALLEDANKAIEQLAGMPLPAGLTIKVVEDTPTQVHLVLPARPDSKGELADAELDAVAGGWWFKIMTPEEGQAHAQGMADTFRLRRTDY